MSALPQALDALLIGFLASLITGLIAYLAARALDREDLAPGLRVSMWRGARLAALAPLASGLIFAFFPALSASLDASGLFWREAVIVEYIAPETTDAEPASAAPYTPRPLRPLDSGLADRADAAPAPDAVAGEAGFWASLDVTPILWFAYGAGLVWALGQFILRRLALAGLIATSQKPTRDLAGLFNRWRANLNIKEGEARLRIVDESITPFVTGWRPVIILPRGLAAHDQSKAAEMALLHELVHVRRGDERDRLIGELATMALWFSPPLKHIEARLAHAREMACDAEALDLIGGRAQRRAYAGALIDAARAGLRPAPSMSAFGPENKRNREMRIKAILSHDKRASASKSAAAAAMGAFALMITPAIAAQATATALILPEKTELASGDAVDAALDKSVRAQTDYGRTPIRRTLDSSPLASLAALESLSALEDIDGSSVLTNPANWAAIGAYASGATTELNLTLRDEDGNPIRISVSEQDGEHVRLSFTDDEGRENTLVAEDAGDRQQVSLTYDNAADPFFSIVAQGDTADLTFNDEGGPVRMLIEEDEREDTAAISMIDVRTGGRTDLFFTDTNDDTARAAADGRVRAVGQDLPGENSVGNYVVIDHEGGWSTVYHGMQSVAVSQGQRLAYGDVIGEGSRRDYSDWEPMDDGFGDLNIVNNLNMSIVRTSEVEL